MAQETRIGEIRKQANPRAVVFLHGFTGDQDDTWGNFPPLLGSELAGWDIFTMGYASTLLPDVAGIWSSDPDLPVLATNLCTECGLPPLKEYSELALVAHSMGGLIVQRGLLDEESLVERVTHVVVFGTPSNGIRKASWIAFWKRSIRNMAAGGDFIKKLRAEWSARFPGDPSFLFLTVAGTKDQFVPPTSSLDPFPKKTHRVVDGNHLDIVKPRRGSTSVRLLVDALSTEPGGDVTAVSPPPEPRALPAAPTEQQVVKRALELDHADRRREAVKLLEQHVDQGTDVMGTLGGRYKRIWLENEDISYAERAHRLYTRALRIARKNNDSGQIYYHAINVAFLELVAFERAGTAKQHAKEALEHVGRSEECVWSLTTLAEANLYLGDIDRALDQYRELAQSKWVESWQLASASLQAVHIARALDDPRVRDEIDAIFSPGAKKVFVSYSHADRDWLKRLRILLKPYLEESHIEFWDDSLIRSGDQWRKAIQRALDAAGVAVALASSSFLASDFITDKELPDIIKGARTKELRLIWVALDPAGYEVSPLYDFQCVNDPDRPLSGLDCHEQQTVLLNVARKIKQAALSEDRV